MTRGFTSWLHTLEIQTEIGKKYSKRAHLNSLSKCLLFYSIYIARGKRSSSDKCVLITDLTNVIL